MKRFMVRSVVWIFVLFSVFSASCLSGNSKEIFSVGEIRKIVKILERVPQGYPQTLHQYLRPKVKALNFSQRKLKSLTEIGEGIQKVITDAKIVDKFEELDYHREIPSPPENPQKENEINAAIKAMRVRQNEDDSLKKKKMVVHTAKFDTKKIKSEISTEKISQLIKISEAGFMYKSAQKLLINGFITYINTLTGSNLEKLNDDYKGILVEESISFKSTLN